MERRTVLTALAAAPLAALASTAHALGRRRRPCCEQQAYAEYVQPLAGDVPKGVDTPTLTITDDSGGSGMPIHKVVITVNVTVNNIPGVIEETVMNVEARLIDSSGGVGTSFDYDMMTLTAGLYKLEKSGLMLTAGQPYRAQVRATIEKKEYGLSAPKTAP
jgi:hypothetical protein